MRRLRPVFVALASLSLAAASATAAAPPPSQDYAIGSGSTTFFGSFSFEAVSGPSGENPSGSGTAVLEGRQLIATEATCLAVTGNTATISARLAPNPEGWSFVLVKAVDNGPGGTDAFIATVGIGFPFATAPDCTRPFPEVVPMPLVTGDIIVHDAPPLPTSKEQCKNGGWRNFPEFENQGECVSFVATGAKKPPTG